MPPTATRITTHEESHQPPALPRVERRPRATGGVGHFDRGSFARGGRRCGLRTRRSDRRIDSCGLAEVGRDDGRMGEHLARRATGHDLALVEGHQAVGDAGDQGHVVLDDQQRGVEAIAEGDEQRGQGLGLALGDAGGGLVEQDHGWSVGHDTGQVDHAPRPGGQLAHELVAERAQAGTARSARSPGSATAASVSWPAGSRNGHRAVTTSPRLDPPLERRPRWSRPP